MRKSIIELNESTFDKLTKKGSWVIDFWAEWCGPCKIMEPYFAAAAKELGEKINFAKVNVDECYELAQKFEIMAVPTTLFIKDGEITHASTGVLTKDKLLEIVEENF